MSSLFFQKTPTFTPKKLEQIQELARTELISTYQALAQLYANQPDLIKLAYRHYGVSFKYRQQTHQSDQNQQSPQDQQIQQYNEVKFKYYPTCQFDLIMQHAARGTTFVETPTNLYLHAAACKFFNEHEMGRYWGPACNLDAFIKATSQGHGQLVLTPKYDGTCIMAWYCQVSGKVRCTTLGSVDSVMAQGRIDNSPTFDQLALEMLGEEGQAYVIEQTAEKGGVVVYEMCHRKWNPIVTKYDCDFISPLYQLDHRGRPTYHQLMENSKAKWIRSGHSGAATNWPHLSAEKIRAQIEEYKEEIRHDTTLGQNPEGLVAYWLPNPIDSEPMPDDPVQLAIPIAKIKFKEYLQAHRTVELAVGSINNMHAVEFDVCQGKDDDRTEPLEQAHSKLFRQYLQDLTIRLEESVPQLVAEATSSESGKNYANLVQSGKLSLPKWMTNFLYNHRQTFSELPDTADFEAYQQLTAWLASPYKGGKPPLSVLQEQTTESDTAVVPWFSLPANITSTTTTTTVTSTIKKPIRQTRRNLQSNRSRFRYLIVDFDATIHQTPRKPASGFHGDWWQSEESLPGKLFARVARMVKAYQQAGFRLVFLTGRQAHLRAKITQILHENSITDFGLITPPHLPNVVTTRFKRWVLETLTIPTIADRIDVAIYLEDNLDQLKAAHNLNWPYRSLLLEACQDRLHPFKPTGKGLIVLLAGPPGFGKTTCIKAAMQLLTEQSEQSQSEPIQIHYCSMDQLRLEAFRRAQQQAHDQSDQPGQPKQSLQDTWQSTMHNKEMTARLYPQMTTGALRAYSAGKVVIVDMVNQNASNYKFFQRAGCRILQLTMVPTTYVTSKKGKKTLDFDVAFAAFPMFNLLQRTIERHDNSTFVIDHPSPQRAQVKALKTVCEQSQRCVFQVDNRNGRFLTPYASAVQQVSDESRQIIAKFVRNNIYKNNGNNYLDELPSEVLSTLESIDGILRKHIPKPEQLGRLLAKEILASLTPEDSPQLPQQPQEVASLTLKSDTDYYLGLPVNPELLTRFPQPKSHQPVRVPHLTIVSPNEFATDPDKYIDQYLGREVTYRITGVVYHNDVTFAVCQLLNQPADDLLKQVEVPHITIAVKPPAHAKLSRELLMTQKCNIQPIEPSPPITSTVCFL